MAGIFDLAFSTDFTISTSQIERIQQRSYQQGKRDMQSCILHLSDGALAVLVEMHQGTIADDCHAGQLLALNDETYRRTA